MFEICIVFSSSQTLCIEAERHVYKCTQLGHSLSTKHIVSTVEHKRTAFKILLEGSAVDLYYTELLAYKRLEINLASFLFNQEKYIVAVYSLNWGDKLSGSPWSDLKHICEGTVWVELGPPSKSLSLFQY